jgi:hypothetical protein
MENTNINPEDAIIQKVKSQIDAYKSDLDRGVKSVSEMEEKLKGLVTQIDLMPKSLDGFKKEIMDIIVKQGETITSLKETRVSQHSSDNDRAIYKESLESYLNSESVKHYVEGKTSRVPRQLLKSVTNLTTNYTSGTAHLSDLRDTNIYKNPVIKVFVADLIKYLGTTVKRDFPYIQESDFIDLIPNLTENQSTTELGFTLTESSATAKRIAAKIPVSKWMLRSVEQASNYIMERLPQHLKANLNFQMLFGSGSGAELTGLFKAARTVSLADISFTAGAIASVATYDSGTKVIVTFTAAHGLFGGETLTIANSSNYNGSYAVTMKSKKQIMITASYVGESTSAWTATSVNPFKDSVVSAGLLDALVCAMGQFNGQELYTPTAILVNPADYYKMLYLNKATTAEIIDSAYVLETINGIKYLNGAAVIPVEKVPAGQFLIGDLQNAAGWLDYTDEGMGGETISIIEDTTTKDTNSVMVFIERDIIMPIFNTTAFVKGVFATIISYIDAP